MQGKIHSVSTHLKVEVEKAQLELELMTPYINGTTMETLDVRL
jgi:hypothetical protein